MSKKMHEILLHALLRPLDMLTTCQVCFTAVLGFTEKAANICPEA